MRRRAGTDPGWQSERHRFTKPLREAKFFLKKRIWVGLVKRRNGIYDRSAARVSNFLSEMFLKIKVDALHDESAIRAVNGGSWT